MKKILILGLATAIFLSGCAYSKLTKIEKKYGRPARVEIECIDNSIVCDEETYYNNNDAIKHIIWFYYWQTRGGMHGQNLPYGAAQDYAGWLCWEILADKNGEVISHRKYIEQPNRPQQGRTPIQTKDKPLPGMRKTE